MLQKATRTTYAPIQLTETQVAELNEKMAALSSGLELEDEGAVLAAETAIKAGVLIPGLPSVDPEAPLAESYGEWAPRIIVSHYSIVLFLAGKRIEGDDHTAISVNRPLALRGKAHIIDQSAFMEGQLRLSDISHIQINNAWSESSSLRAACLSEFSLFSQSDTEFTQDLIYTTMHLLKYSNMTHAKITYDFLLGNTWAIEVPALRKSIGVFLDSVRASASYADHLLPYLKLIYGDKIDIFPRKDLEPLIACAVAVGAETNPTLLDFYVSGEHQSIVDAFLEEYEARKRIRSKELAKREALVTSEDTPEDSED
jgi:hypothetical protein